MQTVKNVSFSREEVLRAEGESLFHFELAPNFLLFVFFHEDPKKSFCVTLDHSRRNAADCMSWIVERLATHDKKVLTVKLLFSHADRSRPQSNQLETLADLFVLSGFRVDGKVEREGSILGILNFSSARLSIEKKVTEIRKVRVLIVDDSKTIRDLLTRILSADSQIEIVGAIEDPRKVESLLSKLKPDVITLDIHMPYMDGVTLLKSYLPRFQIPTVMISSVSIEDGTHVLDALEFGAVDYIQKPSFNELSAMAPIMIEKIKSAANAKVKLKIEESVLKRSVSTQLNPRALIAIGSSTGGTEALKTIFTMLPPQIPPILVVQHIPAVFSDAFARRLDQLCPFEVKEAADGDEVRSNRVLIAPGGFQMTLVSKGGGLRVQIRDGEVVNRHKPSVDHLFLSMPDLIGRYDVIAAILTGMGADGAKGMKALKDRGALTLAQDEATSVVYGMPREAFKLGCVDQVLPIDQIANYLIELSAERNRRKFA